MTGRKRLAAGAAAIASVAALTGCTANGGAVEFATWQHCLQGGDYVTGTDAADRFTGSSGTDRYSGGAGNDNISLGSGDDCAIGEGGTDTINGGSGNDMLIAGGTDTVVGGSGRDLIFISSEIEQGTGQASVQAGSDSDVVISLDGEGGDRIDCGGGTDYVLADEGDILTNCEETLAID